MDSPELSIVTPVFKEGEAVEPVIRALTAAVHAPHEVIVVYDFDEDPTVPVIDRLALELPQVRGLRNDLGRGVSERDEGGDRRVHRPIRPHLHGRWLGRAARRRSDGGAGA